MQTHGRFKVKNIQNENEQNLSSEHESHEADVAEENQNDGLQEGTVERLKLKKVVEDENDGKITPFSTLNEGITENQQPVHLISSEISDSETKGRFKIKNVSEIVAESKPVSSDHAAENPEVKGRFKVKNVKPVEENLVKETMPNLDKANNEGSDRPRSKSSPQLNNGAPVVTNSTNGSSKKGRFTVTTAGVNSNSSSPSKSQNLTQEFPINPHPLSNGPVQFTSEIMSSTQFGLSSEARPHDEKIDVDSHASVGIALELKGNNQTPSAAKKPKSRFTVKTISLEDEKDYQEVNQQAVGPLPPLPHSNPSPKTVSQGLLGTSMHPKSKSVSDISSFTEAAQIENGGSNFSPTSHNLHRFQQLLDNNFQILLALQQEMKLHGLSIPEMGSNQQKLSTAQTQKSVHFEKTINGTEDHNDHSSNITSSTKIPLHSTPNLPPTHANDKDRDKAFGKMSHYVNELKKELDSAAKARKEHGLETQRLRERCIQLEEKLQSEKSKNSLLEEQLEKSLKKQRELQAQLDALHSSHQSSLPIQSVTGVDITQQQHPPPPLGTPNGTSSSKSQTVSLGTNVPSASMPSKSNSASNIPSLCVAGFVNHDLSASVTSQQALNSTSTPASAGNTPRISNGYATIGSTLHENPQSLPTSSNLPVDSQLIPQSDEFENFIASRSAPIVEEWTDTSASLTI